LHVPQGWRVAVSSQAQFAVNRCLNTMYINRGTHPNDSHAMTTISIYGVVQFIRDSKMNSNRPVQVEKVEKN
jgi:hypothetical protein